MIKIFISFVFILTISYLCFAQSDSLSLPPKTSKLDSIAFAVDIENRAPVDVKNVFEPPIRKVFCWTKITINRAPQTIKHAWYHEGEKVSEIPLRLRFASGRLWSYKTVSPGKWKVDIINEAEEVIGSAEFVVK